MAKEKFIIDEEQIDSIVYSSTLAKLNEQVGKFDAAILVFMEYHLPVGEEFLKSTTSDLSLRKYLDQEAEREIKERGGILIDQDERAAIISKCVDTYQAVKVASKVINEAINRPILPILWGDVPTLDISKIGEIAKMAATYHVDAEKLMQYHQLISDIRKAQMAAREFEDANNLRHFSDGSTTIDFATTFGSTPAPHTSVNLERYFNDFTDDTATWVDAMGAKFKKQ